MWVTRELRWGSRNLDPDSIPLVQSSLHTSFPETSSRKMFFLPLEFIICPALAPVPQLCPSSPSSEANSKWLDSLSDSMANIHTFSACLGESLGPGTLVLGKPGCQMVLELSF